MNLKEFDDFKLQDAVKFHNELNPALFDRDGQMHPEVREQLLVIAKDFQDELGIKDLEIKDITISGSNAAYTYTPHSDIDLHLLVDIGQLDNSEVYRELFTAKKTVYNDTHDIKIHGYDVELYVQDSKQPHRSLGEYSVLKDKWNRYPSKSKANFDENSARQKFLKLVQLSELALRSDDLDKVNNLLDTIKKYRQAGLDQHGEFGAENLAFKALRSRGIVEKLWKHRDKLHSLDLSMEEDYDPNGPPPGPEFKPTMPRGTVRVDVSDVYDWYKLGQHISNLKGLGHHDFGKGPPSTIMAFGSEDEEHKYIDALEKTGLTTTDIDPVDPNQPKGMKRQKVDPTFNVDEETLEEQLRKELNEFTKSVKESSSGYKEIEFVCANPEFPNATDPELQKRLFNELKKIDGVIPLYQDQSYYSEGQRSLTAIYKDNNTKKQIVQLAKKLGVTIDLVQPVSDNYVDRAIRGEHEGQILESALENKVTFKIKKGKSAFSIELLVDGKTAGIYQYSSTSNRHIAEVYPEFQGKGYGKLLVLKALETANKLGMDFIEDESRTQAYDNVIDSLESNGYIVRDDEYLYLTQQGLQYLNSQLNEGASGDPTVQDLKDVADWMNTTPDKLKITVKQEPIEKFIKQIREMYGTYDEFPEDEQRTNRILKLLKRGAKPLPMYVEANDPDLFVMEGRHRMVAFWLAGMKIIPVAYVSTIVEEGASGYIPSNAEKNDWRFKTGLTVDVHPDSIKKNAQKLGLGKIKRSGVPPRARTDGKF